MNIFRSVIHFAVVPQVKKMKAVVNSNLWHKRSAFQVSGNSESDGCLTVDKE